MHPVFRGVGVVRDLHRRLSLDPAGRPAEAAGDDGAPPGWGALSRTTDCANVWSFANQIELECRAGSAGHVGRMALSRHSERATASPEGSGGDPERRRPADRRAPPGEPGPLRTNLRRRVRYHAVV